MLKNSSPDDVASMNRLKKLFTLTKFGLQKIIQCFILQILVLKLKQVLIIEKNAALSITGAIRGTNTLKLSGVGTRVLAKQAKVGKN